MAAERVLILEDDLDLAYTYEQVITLLTDFQVVVSHSLSELQARRDEILACKVAIIDINLGEGEPSGIDAYQWLCDQSYEGKVFFMTGHAKSHPLVVKAGSMGNATVLTKPLEIGKFLDLISGKESN